MKEYTSPKIEVNVLTAEDIVMLSNAQVGNSGTATEIGWDQLTK